MSNHAAHLNRAFIEEQRKRLEALREQLLAADLGRLGRERSSQEERGGEAEEFEDKAQTSAANEINLALGTRLVRPIEPFENVGQIPGSDTLARIHDVEHGVMPFRGHPDADLASRTIILDRVADQVHHHLAELFVVAQAGAGAHLRVKADAALIGQRAQQVDGLHRHRLKIAGLTPAGLFSGIQAG